MRQTLLIQLYTKYPTNTTRNSLGKLSYGLLIVHFNETVHSRKPTFQMSQQNCKYRRKTRERGAHAECGKSYEISLPATLTSIFMRKSNVRIGGRGPHFGSNSPPYGAKLQSNQPGVYPGDGQFWITVELLGTNTSLMRTPLYYGHLSNTDTSLLRTVSYVPTKFSYISSKKNL